MIGYNESGLVFLPEFNKMSTVSSVVGSLIAVCLMQFEFLVWTSLNGSPGLCRLKHIAPGVPASAGVRPFIG
jgi:hypothetical protein